MRIASQLAARVLKKAAPRVERESASPIVGLDRGIYKGSNSDEDNLEDEDSPTEPSSGDESEHQQWQQWHEERKKQSKSEFFPIASGGSRKDRESSIGGCPS